MILCVHVQKYTNERDMYFVVALSFFLALGNAHALFMHPTPRHDGDDRLKQPPCGVGLTDDWTAVYTDLTPGPMWVTFRETINHMGAPYRIALTVGSDSNYDNYVLLDHIPHNNKGNVTENNPRGKWHKVQVTIPDVNCSQCALQLIQIMTDKFTTPCTNPAGLSTSCGSPLYAYFSCANVRISGSQPATSLAPFYNSLAGGTISARKPYRPNEAFMNWTLGSDSYWSLEKL